VRATRPNPSQAQINTLLVYLWTINRKAGHCGHCTYVGDAELFLLVVQVHSMVSPTILSTIVTRISPESNLGSAGKCHGHAEYRWYLDDIGNGTMNDTDRRASRQQRPPTPPYRVEGIQRLMG